MAQLNLKAPTIAVIGSGPSGCYIAQFLRKRWRDAEITIFDRLRLPYGLVRYGVAPDHHGTKAVARQFDRLFEREGVRFMGNTEIGAGSTLSLDRIRAAFDIVVLATGLYADRPLTVSGAGLPQVYGSGRLTRLINGHPDERAESFVLGNRVAIVGHGNVAVDLVRIFLTQPNALTELEIDPTIVDAVRPVEHIDIVGRSLPQLAKFDTSMVRELSKLEDVRFRADGLGDDSDAPEPTPGASVRREAVVELVANSRQDASRTVHFHFGWTPQEVLGAGAVTGIRFASATGSEETLTLEVDSVCTAIGFAEATDAAVRRGEHESAAADLETGYLDDGLYCVGWLRRGPRGTIPENRADARMVAEVIGAAVEAGSIELGKPGLASIADLIADAAPSSIDPDPASLHSLVKELS